MIDRRMLALAASAALAGSCAGSPRTTSSAPPPAPAAPVIASPTGPSAPWPAPPPAPAAPSLRTQTRPLPHDLVQMRSLRGVTISRDGNRVAYVVRTPTFDPKAKPSPDDTKAGWKIDQQLFVVDRAGGAPRQLTFGDDPVNAPRFSPDGQSLAFVRKKGAKPAIHVISLSGGEPRAIATGEYEPQRYDWTPDGKHIAFLATQPETEEVKTARWKRGGARAYDNEWQQTHLIVVPVAGGEPRHVNAGTDAVGQFAWSPDGKYVALLVSPSSDPAEQFSRRKLVVLPAQGGEPRVLAQGADGASFVITQLAWSPDSRKIAYALTSRGGMSHIDELRVRALDDSLDVDVAAKLDLEINGVVWAGDSRAVIASALARTVTKLYRLPLAGAPAEIPLGKWVAFGMEGDAAGRYLAAVASTPTRPAEPVVIDTQRRTITSVAAINPQAAEWPTARNEIFSWKNREGVALDGVLTVTTQAAPGAPPPLVVIPHGGPDGVSLEGWNGWAQFWAARGYSVFEPNYRGGIAYGRRHYEANRGRLGEIELIDIESGVDALIAAGKADPARLFYGSWSWGGYLSAWTLGHTDRYRAFMVGAGVIDVVVQYATSDINHGLAADWEFKGRPWSQPEQFERANPARSLANAKAPTLIIHGENDERVPFVNGQILYRALHDRGVPVTFWAYPREPHGFGEPAHIEHFLELWGSFFDQQLAAK